jgi:hypothetical protein
MNTLLPFVIKQIVITPSESQRTSAVATATASLVLQGYALTICNFTILINRIGELVAKFPAHPIYYGGERSFAPTVILDTRLGKIVLKAVLEKYREENPQATVEESPLAQKPLTPLSVFETEVSRG